MSHRNSGKVGIAALSDLEAERAVLGSILVGAAADHSVMSSVISVLGEDGGKFYMETHGAIYKAMVRLHKSGVPPEYITLCAALEDDGMLDEVGGRPYIASLAAAVPTFIYAEHYAKVVRNMWVRRRAVELGKYITKQAYSADSVDTLLRRVRLATERAFR